MKKDNNYYISLISKKIVSINDIDALERILVTLNKNYDIIWSTSRKKRCNNEKTWNLQSYDLHEEDNKNNKKDPIISYGNNFNYVCYPLSELIFHWNPVNIKKVGIYTRPDYMEGDDLPRELSHDQMIDLIKVLQKYKPKRTFSRLIKTIRTGMHFATNPGETFVQNTPEIYKNLPLEHKYLIYRALAHLLVIGVNTYITKKQENQRNINTISAINTYFNWVDTLPENVKQFINSFYRIRVIDHLRSYYAPNEYNLFSNDGTSLSFINGMLKSSKEGDLCVQMLTMNLIWNVASYKKFFITDISDKEYIKILEKDMRDIIGTKDINLDQNYQIKDKQKQMIFEQSINNK